MGKYGEAAIKAVKLFSSGIAKTPKDAWEKATIEIFGDRVTSQYKGCPRNAFLGLCEEGIVKGIAVGNYTKSKKNKEYAIKAIQILKITPELASNKEALWTRVISGENKSHNQQMDVIVSLWNSKLLEVTN